MTYLRVVFDVNFVEVHSGILSWELKEPGSQDNTVITSTVDKLNLGSYQLTNVLKLKSKGLFLFGLSTI